jgi:hypothetical protein
MTKDQVANAAAKAKLAMVYIEDMAAKAALKVGDVDGDGKLTLADIKLAHEKAEAHAALFTQKATPLGAIASTVAVCLPAGWFMHVGWAALMAWWVK